MRPTVFAAAMLFSATLGFSLGRCTHPPRSPNQTETNDSHSEDIVATVLAVTDGDTLEVALPKYAGLREKIRLLAINAPERGQEGYSEATEALDELISGKSIRLSFENVGVLKRDKYGRILAYVFVEDLNINIELVRLGWSAYVSQYGGQRFSAAFVQAEESARTAKRGIWAYR